MARSLDPMTLTEAAESCGLNATTLRVQINNRRLSAVKRGGVWWVTRKSLDFYLKNIARNGRRR